MIQKGEKVILWKKNWMTLIDLDGDTKKITGIGILDTERIIGKEWGSVIDLGRDQYSLLHYSPLSKMLNISLKGKPK